VRSVSLECDPPAVDLDPAERPLLLARFTEPRLVSSVDDVLLPEVLVGILTSDCVWLALQIAALAEHRVARVDGMPITA
jgi:hypothetical protein